MPIKGLTDRPTRLPRIGKIHLGVKVKKGGKPEYPKATDYFVFEPQHAQYDELVTTYGKEPKELRILLPVEDTEHFAQQYYRLYSRTRGLVCKGDGETALRMIDKATGAVANRDTTDVTMSPMTCDGRDCPEYGPRACGEVMNLQFILPDVGGFGVWQIDTGSINSIININSAVDMVRSVYGRVCMVPLILTLEPKEVTNPDDGKKKTVRVLNLRSPDKMIEAYHKATIPPIQLMTGIAAEIAEPEAAELPPAGDEVIHSDLPYADELNKAVEAMEAHAFILSTHDGKCSECGMVKEHVVHLPAPTADEELWPPDGPTAAKVSIKGLATKAVKANPSPPHTDVPKTATIGNPVAGMTFADLLAYVRAHQRTEGWLFKQTGMSVDETKADPYACAMEIKQLMAWGPCGRWSVDGATAHQSPCEEWGQQITL